jgi:hypothetical protein
MFVAAGISGAAACLGALSAVRKAVSLAPAEAMRPEPTLEILEGARLVRDVAVASIVDEPVGLGAYMEAGALHRLLTEGPTFSGAYVKVDPVFEPFRTSEVFSVAAPES